MYIAFEGVEGCGKTTLCRLTAEWLRSVGRKVVLTKEPGGTQVGEKLRSILLRDEITPLTELFLYLADRAQHIEEIVKPNLGSGATVISDRCFMSTLAYQGFARGIMDPEELLKLCLLSTKGLIPDLIILIDIDPKVSLKRIEKPDRIEREPLKFHEKVRLGFLHAAKILDNVKVIQGNKSIQELFEEVKSILEFDF